MAQRIDSSRAISLDDLIALNDEIIALVRAGVPLGSGLRDVGSDLPGSLGRISRALGERIQQGEGLESVLSRGDANFPPAYRAVVAAGLRSGRLPAALEILATTTRRLAELRRMVSLAMLYPLIIFFITYSLFTFFVLKIFPALADLSGANSRTPLLGWLGRLQGSFDTWGPIVPLVVLSLSGLWWYRSRNATGGALSSGELSWSLRRWSGWFPSLGNVLRDGRAGVFCDTLATMLEQEVPLPEALRLAGAASGDRAIGASAERLADWTASGRANDQLPPTAFRFAPLLGWLVRGNQPRRQLARSMRYAANIYHQRAVRRAEWLSSYLPLILTAAIGGTVTLLYAISLFLPLSRILTELGAP